LELVSDATEKNDRSKMKTIRHLRIIFCIILVLIMNNISFGQYDDEFDSNNRESSIRFINFTSATLAVGGHNTAIGARIINGAIIKNITAVGLGIAYDNYSSEGAIPIFADFRFFPGLKHDNGAYFFADVGYTFEATNIFNNAQEVGPYFNAGVGIALFGQGATGLTFDCGYKIQRTPIYWSNVVVHGNSGYMEGGSNNVNNSYFSVGVGVTF
jgi:hypothetical protein